MPYADGLSAEYPLYFSGILGETGIDEDEFEKQPILRDIYVVGEEINVILSEMIISGRSPVFSAPTWIRFSRSIRCGRTLRYYQYGRAEGQILRDKLRLTKQKFRDLRLPDAAEFHETDDAATCHFGNTSISRIRPEQLLFDIATAIHNADYTTILRLNRQIKHKVVINR